MGVRITDGGPDERHLRAGVVIGADGLRSRVARLVHAERTYTVPNATANLYAYHQDLGLDGYHWYYALGTAAGTMQTNDGDTCVFASLPPRRFERDRSRGLEAQYHEVVAEVSPELADHVAQATRSSKIRGFAGVPGFLRQSAGPGWALVGDAGYFKDPLTAHGMTDALRDAELLARAVVQGSDAALVEYQTTRDGLAMGLLDVTDRIASLEWDLEEVQDLHHTLSREMKDEVRFLKTLDEAFVTAEAA